MNDQYFASCPVGWESLLLKEAQQFKLPNVKNGHGGIYFDADLKQLYNYCLYSHVASKVFYPICEGKATSVDDIYELAYSINWNEYITPDASIRVDFSGTNEFIRNTQFGAQKVKDAIVDKLVHAGAQRPDVDKTSPDIKIHTRLQKGKLYVSLDLCNESLHKRGYRVKQGAAPLKENLAAAILMRTGLTSNVAEHNNYTLLDPMCGSGTFLIEGALMVLGIAPGVLRSFESFTYWPKHDAAIWQAVHNDAVEQKKQAIEKQLSSPAFYFYGSDSDSAVIDCAQHNIAAAGLDGIIRVSELSAESLVKPEVTSQTGLIIVNPPYGERLGHVEALQSTYRNLAQRVKAHFEGWQFALFTSNPELARETRLRAAKKNKFRNGPLHAELFIYNVVSQTEAVIRENDNGLGKPKIPLKDQPLSDDAQMVYNRLKKNIKKLKRFVKASNLSCYRIYDADMPEFSAAIDVYNDAIHIQEYAAPKTIDEKKSAYRFEQIKHAVAVMFNCDNDQLFIKTRRKNKGSQQYEKQTQSVGFNKDSCMQVKEGQALFYVNLEDFLDTGLFLDHRPLRLRLSQECANKRFLNLFCYTASASVHAALGGASYTMSVDMSNTYLDWAEENFRLNNMNPRHNEIERADCFQWLSHCQDKFDVIMLDPPTFSNSKKMDDVLDVQRDHIKLIAQCMNILDKSGVLYFSTNFKKFKLDETLLSQYNIENISQKTIDEDFKNNPKIHYCWRITF